MSHADLLIEMLCEELPARFVVPLANALHDGICNGLRSRNIAIGASRALATPRRLAVFIEQVQTQQADQTVERRGPALVAAYKDGQPTKAAEGFARGCGVSVADLETLETDKGSYLNFRQQVAGQPTAALIQEIFDLTIKSMDELVPKRMRWGAGDDSFVRPVHGLVALLGKDVMPIHAFSIDAGRRTYGHRFHAPAAIDIERPDAYVQKLEQAFVLADIAQRRSKIRQQVEDVSKGQALIDEALLDEVTALVEWPEPVLGQFDADFLELPPEVIITTIQEHQRYFPVQDASGGISRQFVTIANIRSRDHAAVVQGNERVVRPRLQDALFFWQQDLKADFSDWLNKLENVTYIKGLGSIADKIRRMQDLATCLAPAFAVDAPIATRAAQLSKADLASHAVFEMPELQGVLGGHYARRKGEPEAVAVAIAEHYAPQGPDDAVPASACGAVVALADKLDSLVSLFSQENLRPTSSKDPYGARRAALGVIRILTHHGRNLSVDALLPSDAEATTRNSLLQFLNDRLRAWLVAQGIDARIVEAVMLQASQCNPCDAWLRCQALQQLQNSPAFEQLAAANKRIRNILGQTVPAASADLQLSEPAELALLAALSETQERYASSLQQQDYVAAVQALALLSDPITRFFDDVMVNAEDLTLRQARHSLIGIFETRCRALADFAALSSG